MIRWASFLCILYLCAVQVSAREITGKVVSIQDGDTITLLDAQKRQHKIRMVVADAPESAQAFGTRAKQNLALLVFGKTVTVETNKKDKFDRPVGIIFEGGKDINLLQIRQGFAWVDPLYLGELSQADRRLYNEAAAQARRTAIGLWPDPNPMPPWVFRKTKRNNRISPELASTRCACDARLTCEGSRGGVFCTTQSGSKRYLKTK